MPGTSFLQLLSRHKIPVLAVGSTLLLSMGGFWWYFYKKVPLPTECALANGKRVLIASLLKAPYRTTADVQRGFAALRQCLQRSKDPRTGFLRVYIIVTRVIVQWATSHAPSTISSCKKPRLVERLLLTFANQYREASYNHLTKKPVSVSWRHFFDYLRAHKDDKFHPAVGMLLAMNAHINEDLPFALFAVRDVLGALKTDYDTIDQLFIHFSKQIVDEADEICLEVGRKLPRIFFDHAIVAAAIVRFRQRSWDLGAEYAQATGAEQQRMKRKISHRADRYARQLREITGATGLTQLFAASAKK